MFRQVYLSNLQAYGTGTYGTGTYGGFDTIKIDDSWQLKLTSNNFSEFSFVIIENENNLTIQEGIEVRFVIDGVVKFAGIITNIERFEDTPGFIHYKCNSFSFEKILDNRRIATVFNNKTSGYIIKYVIDNILYEDNIYKGTIQDGATFEKILFNYSTIFELMEKIRLANPGYNWHVDNDKYLHFYKKNYKNSSYVLDDDFIHKGFFPNQTLNEYRNVQYIEGGRKETNLQPNYSPTPKPDGVSREFTVQFPISQEPIVEINVDGAGWVTQDVGINGIDSGKQFYWTYGSNKVTQDSSETVLTDLNLTPDEIRISYYGLLDVRLKYVDDSKINSRKLIDGHSGKYEEIFQNKDIVTNAAAVQYAKGLIQKYENQKSIELTIEDDIKDFEPNMIVKVEKILFNINDYYFIKSISAKHQTAEHITYIVNLLYGEDPGEYEDYFRSLLQQQNQMSVDDVVTQYKDASEEYSQTGETTVQVMTKLYPGAAVFPSTGLFPGTLTSEVTLNG